MNIQLAKPHISSKAISNVVKVLKSGNLAQGRLVEQLEKSFANYCNAKYAVATNSGTSALHAALFAVGVSSGDEVITTPFTFIATANAIKMVGANPVFVDINPIDYNIDVNCIETAITKKTKAILAVNLFGQPAAYDKLKQIANRYNLVLVEDAAQSIGAKFMNKKSGNLADISCFSFYATKNITCGEGGMITTNSRTYYEKAQRFRQQGQITSQDYNYQHLGYNYRMTEIQAAILNVELNNVDKNNTKRQEIANYYSKHLKNSKLLSTPQVESNRTHVFHQYTVKVRNGSKNIRDNFKKYLDEYGIKSKVFYPEPLYKIKHLSSGKLFLKNTEKMCKSVLSIPIYPSLNMNQTHYIIKKINEYEKKLL